MLRLSIASDKGHICERIVRGMKSGEVHPDSVLTTAPRRDGLGSQILARISVEAAAADLGFDFAHTPFISIAHSEGDPLLWRDRCESELALGVDKKHISDINLPSVDFMTYGLNKTLWKTPRLISMRNMYVHCNRVPIIYKRITQPQRDNHSGHRNEGARRYKIAVHVRRGDVSTKRVSHRYTRNNRIIQSLEKLKEILNNMAAEYEIEIYSNGTTEELSDFLDIGCRINVMSGAIETLYAMREADILLTAKSTFSYVAALYVKGIVLYEPFTHQPMPSWIIRDQNGGFSEAEFVRAWKDLERSQLCT